MSETPGKAWFAPKTAGYGAYPSSWEGWACIAAFVAGLVVLALLLLTGYPRGGVPVKNIIIYLVLVAAMVVGLVLLARAKSSGPWRWRSGAENR
jgi:ABC-type multidrug transport system permease subunit